MVDVFRKGRKDVHRAIVSGDPDDPMRPNGCNLDGGGEWGPVVPSGPRCHVCFAALTEQRRSRGRSKAPLAASAAALALAAAVFGTSLGEPVNILGPFPSGSGTPSPLASIAPGPSVVPPGPTLVPALTPAPTLEPLSTTVPLPTLPVWPTFGPLPSYPPLPTWPPLPQLTLPPVPLPTLKACIHPGTHLGVDPCRWPHQ